VFMFILCLPAFQVMLNVDGRMTVNNSSEVYRTTRELLFFVKLFRNTRVVP